MPGRSGLRVQGNSVAEAIQDGDVVLLKKRHPKSGEICAVRVDRSEATLKYPDQYLTRPEMVLLQPHSAEYVPLEVAAERVVVDGVYS